MTLSASTSSSSSSSPLPSLVDRRHPLSSGFDPQEVASRRIDSDPQYQRPDSNHNNTPKRNRTTRTIRRVDDPNLRHHHTHSNITYVTGGLDHGQNREEDETSEDVSSHRDDRSPASKKRRKMSVQDPPLTPSTDIVRMPHHDRANVEASSLKSSPLNAAERPPPPQEVLHDDNPSRRPGHKAEVDANEKAFHEKFNKEMFNIDLDGNGLDGKPPIIPRASQQFTNEAYEDLLDICFSHQSGESDRWRESLKKHNNRIYEVVKNYTAKVVTNASGMQVKKLFFQGLLAIPQREVFLAIRDCHLLGSRHSKPNVTYAFVKDRYSNITQKMVNKYIELCPTCNARKGSAKRLTKRPAVPVHNNYSFRDRFLICLIDMNDKAQEDVRGVLCKWLLVIQDHSTKLTYCEPIPRKRPIFVAEVLSRICGLIGPPILLQSDDGRESTSRDIVVALRELNEDILTVYGRLRKPDDLVEAVESTKETIHSILQDLEDDQRAKGKTPNWTLLMGQLSSRLNSETNGAFRV
ncbi:hypothetical protein IV203_021713 [Nitzschia inconspicua]|uniref:Integrase catalytic domain-containing protein n=1 Tax=Nitzschia inconspicua TaxID=303405 RepID=A0A9K3PE52_9STRA|nr:hypothetical protein IV203_021713 [Nitzschia inconspicua]